jgi:hypothetical protein
MTDTYVQPWTQEQVERLARDFMGWTLRFVKGNTLADLPDGGVLLIYGFGTSFVSRWEPFTDPRADYQVLQRARERLFSFRRLFRDALNAQWRARFGDVAYVALHETLDRYQTGDYARAVLAVLDQQEESR